MRKENDLRVVIGLNPVLVKAIQEDSKKKGIDNYPFSDIAVFALEELYWALYHEKRTDLPDFDPEKKYSAPNYLRTAEHGYFLVFIPSIIGPEWERLMNDHNRNKTGLLHRAILLHYRDLRAKATDPEYLSKYPLL